MKVCATALLSFLFVVSASAATVTAKPIELPGSEANTVTADMPAPAAYTGYKAQGFRVAFVKPFLTVKSKYSDETYSGSNTTGLDNANGISVGYIYLPLNNMGFTTNFAVINLKEEGDDSVSMLRVDGNVAYALNPRVNFKGGLNLSQFNHSDMREEFKAGVGLQASVGLQFSQNFGADAGAVFMRQIGKGELHGLSLEEAGPEFSLTGTF